MSYFKLCTFAVAMLLSCIRHNSASPIASNVIDIGVEKNGNRVHTSSNLSIGNNLLIGRCSVTDQRIYTDNTIVENSGPSTLNGTLEIYIDAPIKITCIKVEDQITDGNGGTPSLNSGGVGQNWVFIDVKCKYGKGFNFKIHIFGVPDYYQIKG